MKEARVSRRAVEGVVKAKRARLLPNGEQLHLTNELVRSSGPFGPIPPKADARSGTSLKVWPAREPAITAARAAGAWVQAQEVR